MPQKNSGRRNFIGLFGIAVFAASLSSCGGESGNNNPGLPPVAFTYQPPADRGDGWTVAPANSQGISVALLEAMMDAVGAGQFPIIDSIAIAHQGNLVFEETIRTSLTARDDYSGNGDLRRHAQFSVSKSILSILIGIAIEQGIISGTDARYLDHFSYAGYDNWDVRKDDILLQDVLTMRLGLDWDEWNPFYTEPGNQLNDFTDSHIDFSKGLLDLPMSDDPGTRFAYNTIASVSLGQAIENSGPLTLADFLTTHLLLPLNISGALWFDTPTGLPNLGSGLALFTRDLAKFGQMYMDGGTWNGNQIVNSQWISESIQPYVSLSWGQPGTWDWQLDGYGYQWWTGYFDHNGQQVRTYAARGFGQQILMVVPALDLVVAINAHGYDVSNVQANQAFRIISDFILPSLP